MDQVRDILIKRVTFGCRRDPEDMVGHIRMCSIQAVVTQTFIQVGGLDDVGGHNIMPGDTLFYNIQLIDGARNCTYSIFSIDVAGFRKIFPDPHQDIEFAEDFFARVGEEEAIATLEPMWRRPIMKRSANGIHGTLFFECLFQKEFYRHKRECDVIESSVNKHQRELFKAYKKQKGLS